MKESSETEAKIQHVMGKAISDIAESISAFGEGVTANEMSEDVEAKVTENGIEQEESVVTAGDS